MAHGQRANTYAYDFVRVVKEIWLITSCLSLLFEFLNLQLVIHV